MSSRINLPHGNLTTKSSPCFLAELQSYIVNMTLLVIAVLILLPSQISTY